MVLPEIHEIEMPMLRVYVGATVGITNSMRVEEARHELNAAQPVLDFAGAFISYTVLEKRRKSFEVGDWVMDSGAFGKMAAGKEHTVLSKYAADIKRWAQLGNLHAAVQQDYMCQDAVLKAQGMTVAEAQAATTGRYLDLRELDVGGTYILPVLQGQEPEEYAYHTRMMSPYLEEGQWVGVGSIVGRTKKGAWLSKVLLGILEVRPDLRLHGFGLNMSFLSRLDIVTMLYSVDSHGWSHFWRKDGWVKGRSNVEEYRWSHLMPWMERIAEREAKGAQLPLL